MRPTPPWLKRRKNQPELPTPSPPPLPSYALPPLEIISVPPQTKYLTITPPDEEEEAVLRARVPRTKGSNPMGKPQNMNITVVPASHSEPPYLVEVHPV
ncbi:hypothetical protein B0H14DRAFT_3535847 [Mycena olivaceomarginata]|nr:hypothetical protein B0H14DRAFT_3535847 [Mycena olivaceomarginata]